MVNSAPPLARRQITFPLSNDEISASGLIHTPELTIAIQFQVIDWRSRPDSYIRLLPFSSSPGLVF